MSAEFRGAGPTADQLLAVIRTQTDIAKLGLDLSGVMALVAERAQVVACASGAVVELAEGDEMVYRAVAGTAARSLGLRLARATSLSGLCVASATTLRADDCETDPRVDRAACARVGARSMIVVPLIHHGDAVGALKVFSPRLAAFGEGESQVLSLLSELIAAAMYHAARFGTDELFRQATRDSLTGLANRSLFLDRLRHGLVKAKREGRRLAVAMLDMDGLKPINDILGHRAGDAALREIATRVASQVREADTAARPGGDEFAIVLSTVADRESALLVARRIESACGQPFTWEGTRVAIGASVGVALYPDDAELPDGLIEQADRAMYAAKRARKSEQRQ